MVSFKNRSFVRKSVKKGLNKKKKARETLKRGGIIGVASDLYKLYKYPSWKKKILTLIAIHYGQDYKRYPYIFANTIFLGFFGSNRNNRSPIILDSLLRIAKQQNIEYFLLTDEEIGQLMKYVEKKKSVSRNNNNSSWSIAKDKSLFNETYLQLLQDDTFFAWLKENNENFNTEEKIEGAKGIVDDYVSTNKEKFKKINKNSVVYNPIIENTKSNNLSTKSNNQDNDTFQRNNETKETDFGMDPSKLSETVDESSTRSSRP